MYKQTRGAGSGVIGTLLVLLSLMAAMACSSDPEPTSLPTLPPSLTAALTPSSTPAALPTPSPAATLTPSPTPVVLSTSTPTPAAPPMPTSTPVPQLTSTPVPMPTSTPVPAFSLQVTPDTTWQEAFDALTSREQDCIRGAVGQDSLAFFLRLTVASGDSGPFEDYGSLVVPCMDPDIARRLFLSSLLMGMEQNGFITATEDDRICLDDSLSGVDVADLVSRGNHVAERQMFGATMRCLPHVMVSSFLEPLGTGVEVDEEARGCLRNWAGQIDWQMLFLSDDLALFGTLYAGLSVCVPDAFVVVLLDESGGEIDELGDEELACLREGVAGFDWEGAYADFFGSPGALLAAGGLTARCAPG